MRITYESRKWLKTISRGSFKSKEFLRNNPLWFFISNYNFQVQIQTLKTASGGGEQQRDAAGDMDVLRSLEEGLREAKDRVECYSNVIVCVILLVWRVFIWGGRG